MPCARRENLASLATQSGELYQAACAFGLCATITEPERKDKLTVRAIALLKQAVAKGFKDAALLKKDARLNVLRQRDDFTQLLAEVEKMQGK